MLAEGGNMLLEQETTLLSFSHLYIESLKVAQLI
jgi:hypothetical protein